MSVHWTKTAQDHLAAIHGYIAQNSPEYARRMVDRLTTRSQQIEAFPLSGRVVPEYRMDQIREVIEGPYRIIYHITAERIDVLAVIHEARKIL
jgi:toxin ParE1/3/4